MSKTPRTDAEAKRTGWPVFYYDFARQLETELAAKTAELEEAKRLLELNRDRADKYEDKYFGEVAKNRTARANAFDEAYKLAHSLLTCEVDGKQFFLGAAERVCLEKLQDKAAAIRKGEEK